MSSIIPHFTHFNIFNQLKASCRLRLGSFHTLQKKKNAAYTARARYINVNMIWNWGCLAFQFKHRWCEKLLLLLPNLLILLATYRLHTTTERATRAKKKSYVMSDNWCSFWIFKSLNSLTSIFKSVFDWETSSTLSLSQSVK